MEFKHVRHTANARAAFAARWVRTRLHHARELMHGTRDRFDSSSARVADGADTHGSGGVDLGAVLSEGLLLVRAAAEELAGAVDRDATRPHVLDLANVGGAWIGRLRVDPDSAACSRVPD